MKFTKKIVAVVAGVAMCAGLAACGGSRSGQATGGDAKIEKGATIGISMPSLSASSFAARQVLIPSTTIFTSRVASSQDLPSPIKIPARRFRECILVQVTIRSPIPDSP